MPNFRDLSEPKAVEKAIAEYDKLGRDNFLNHYGFRRARNYFLLHNGRQYDSKAIVGAAYGYQFDTPIGPQDFAGGRATVVPLLEELGFKVVTLDIEETLALPEEVSDKMWEGGRQNVTVNRYERNAVARAQCIEKHGSACAICGFDFGKTYGEDFHGFIHVHHKTSLSEIDARYIVDPINDLIPVCPNCHSVIHYAGKTRSAEDIRQLIADNAARRPSLT